jgi:tRNA threonylcarbamoyladenosine biosynthesis protein TsaB
VSEPLLLALDTSTSTASLALFDGAQVLSETTWLAGREHSTRLLIEVQLAFERIGRDPAQLTGLVVARGPGSFTGVRVALSVAKGIAGGFGIGA